MMVLKDSVLRSSTSSTFYNPFTPKVVNVPRNYSKLYFPRQQVKDICNDLDVRSLCHKILQNVSILLNADRGSLFLVQGKSTCGSDNTKK